MKPTDEQVKEFWEWCGFEGKRLFYIDGFWHYQDPNNLWTGLPLGLDSLFEYAVPKLETLRLGLRRYVLLKWMQDVLDGEDPAQALFWVILGVVEETEL